MTPPLESSLIRSVQVPLGDRGYWIYIGSHLLESLGVWLRERCPAPTAVVISDENVAPLYGEAVMGSLRQAGYAARLIVVRPGEGSKSLVTADRIYGELAEAGIERDSPLIALGGGVVGDLTGFVAATWLRGVPFVQVPTTMEADLDASVGGKTAVNHAAGKNLIGAFHQPRLVLIDVETLKSLSGRDLRSGIAEGVKHGVIRDAQLFAWLESKSGEILTGDSAILAEWIEWNCRIKASVVATDEREANLRAILNFGHTIGHAIETDQQYALRHGECVSIGMVAAAQIAVERGHFAAEQAERLRHLLERLELPTRVCQPIDAEVMFAYMQKDKKVAAGRIRFVLPTDIGQVVTVSDVTRAQIEAGFRAIAPLEA